MANKTKTSPTSSLKAGQRFRMVLPSGLSAERLVIETKHVHPKRCWLYVEVVGSKRREFGCFDPETPVVEVRP